METRCGTRSKTSKEIRLVGLLFVVCLMGGAWLSNADIHAETTSANASVTVAEACTMTATVNSAHSAIINPGQYLQPIGETVLKVICNDAGGYAIYAVGNANNEYGNNKLLANVGGSLNSTYDIVTGTATSGSTSNWAMKVSAVSGTYAPTIQNSFGSYHNVPTTYTKVAQLNSMTDATTGSSVSTTYAAYVKSDQPAGSYNGKVKYTMVHPTTETPVQPQTTQAGKICYYPNGSNVEGTMGCQTVSTSATSATLLASNFSRTGYGFAGWSDKYDYETNPNANFYGPNEDITFTAGQYTGTNNGLSLYAVWVKSAGDFQDASKTASVCSGLTAASVSSNRSLASISALTDTRDNQTYAIAKLADGNCWMIENLRLDNTAQLTTLNTNNPLNDGTNVTLKHNYTDTQTYNTLSATSSVAYNADTAPDGWCRTDSAACDDQSRLRTDNTSNRVTYTSGQTMSSTAVNLYSYGNYYNWYSATAGRGTYSFSTNNNSTAGDLCPSGWRLPKGGNKTRIESDDDNDFWNLIVDALNGGTNPANYASGTQPYYNGSTEAGPVDALIRTWPNNFVHSGVMGGASLVNRGSDGYYWSSTAYSTSYAYYLSFYSALVYPGTYSYYKYYGRTIRCIVSPSA